MLKCLCIISKNNIEKLNNNIVENIEKQHVVYGIIIEMNQTVIQMKMK